MRESGDPPSPAVSPLITRHDRALAGDVGIMEQGKGAGDKFHLEADTPS